MVHNVNEWLGIVRPIRSRRRLIGRLLSIGLTIQRMQIRSEIETHHNSIYHRSKCDTLIAFLFDAEEQEQQN